MNQPATVPSRHQWKALSQISQALQDQMSTTALEQLKGVVCHKQIGKQRFCGSTSSPAEKVNGKRLIFKKEKKS